MSGIIMIFNLGTQNTAAKENTALFSTSTEDHTGIESRLPFEARLVACVNSS